MSLADKTKRIVCTVRLDGPMAAEIKQLSAETDLKQSDLMRLAVRAGLPILRGRFLASESSDDSDTHVAKSYE